MNASVVQFSVRFSLKFTANFGLNGFSFRPFAVLCIQTAQYSARMTLSHIKIVFVAAILHFNTNCNSSLIDSVVNTLI